MLLSQAYEELRFIKHQLLSYRKFVESFQCTQEVEYARDHYLTLIDTFLLQMGMMELKEECMNPISN